MVQHLLRIGDRRIPRSVDGWRIGPPAGGDLGRGDFACPTEAALAKWVRRLLGSTAHERRVADVATDLFDVTGPLHKLGPTDLRLLRWAAIVHDVGRCVCDETHPADGADLVRAERSLPLSAADRRALAFLTLHHRGKVPPAGRDGVLAPSDDRDRLLRVLALLRAADGLDNRALARRSDAPPRVVFGLTLRPARPATLHVTCYLAQDSAKARRVYGRRKKFRLLEETLGCTVVPQVVTSDAMRAVA